MSQSLASFHAKFQTIKAFKHLLDEGAITPEEFTMQKTQIFGTKDLELLSDSPTKSAPRNATLSSSLGVSGTTPASPTGTLLDRLTDGANCLLPNGNSVVAQYVEHEAIGALEGKLDQQWVRMMESGDTDTRLIAGGANAAYAVELPFEECLLEEAVASAADFAGQSMGSELAKHMGLEEGGQFVLGECMSDFAVGAEKVVLGAISEGDVSLQNLEGRLIAGAAMNLAEHAVRGAVNTAMKVAPDSLRHPMKVDDRARFDHSELLGCLAFLAPCGCLQGESKEKQGKIAGMGYCSATCQNCGIWTCKRGCKMCKVVVCLTCFDEHHAGHHPLTPSFAEEPFPQAGCGSQV